MVFESVHAALAAARAAPRGAKKVLILRQGLHLLGERECVGGVGGVCVHGNEFVCLHANAHTDAHLHTQNARTHAHTHARTHTHIDVCILGKWIPARTCRARWSAEVCASVNRHLLVWEKRPAYVAKETYFTTMY